jgi:hypothetical protein
MNKKPKMSRLTNLVQSAVNGASTIDLGAEMGGLFNGISLSYTPPTVYGCPFLSIAREGDYPNPAVVDAVQVSLCEVTRRTGSPAGTLIMWRSHSMRNENVERTNQTHGRKWKLTGRKVFRFTFTWFPPPPKEPLPLKGQF